MFDMFMYDDRGDTTNTGGVGASYHRDYLMGRLSNVLTVGQTYCVTFYVVMSNQASYAIDHIGAYLDDGSIDTVSHCGWPLMNDFTPQVYATSIISDSVSWTKIQGSFVANGTEKYITIGNFFDTAHTNKIRVGPSVGSLYEVDDVSVIASDAVADAGPDKNIYTGDTTSIGVAVNGDGMPCYWYVLGSTTPVDSGGTIHVQPAATNTYVVAMDLCGVVTYDTVTVNVTPCPAVAPAFSDTGSQTIGFTYTGAGVSIDSVVWSFGDGNTSNAMNPVHTYTTTGTYHACVRVYTACAVDSVCNDVVVRVDGIKLLTPKGEPSVWPNPVGSELHVDGASGTILTITDVVGRVAYKAILHTDHEAINTAALQKGIYIIQLADDSTGARSTSRIVKE